MTQTNAMERPSFQCPCCSFFIESKILPVNMVHFDAVASLMHDIWKGLAPLPIRALFTRSNKIHGDNTRHAAKGNDVRKTLFRALKHYYGIKFLQTGEIFLKQSLRKKIRGVLFETR